MPKCPKCNRDMKIKRSNLVNIDAFYLCESCGYKKHKFMEILEKRRVLVKKRIKEYLYRLEKENILRRKDIEEFHWKITSDYVERGGKYLRSTLIGISAEAFGIPIEKTLLTGAAMEVCENWLLVHDDIEDKSLSRRGGPTLHLKYNPELAINAGDALHLVMWKMLRDNEHILGSKKTFEIMDEFYRMLFRTTIGQTAELLFIKEDLKTLKEEDFYYIADGKTGYYSIAGPLRLGAIIADRKEERIMSLFDEFGRYLGRAFQITDDILDLTSDFKGLKKQKGNDLYEGKRTLIIAHLVKNATEEELKKVSDIFNKKREDKNEEDINYLFSLIEKYESVEYATTKAKEYSKKALDIYYKMNFFEDKKAAENILLALDFIINRDH